VNQGPAGHFLAANGADKPHPRKLRKGGAVLRMGRCKLFVVCLGRVRAGGGVGGVSEGEEVGEVVVAVEEHDGFGSGVVDADDSGRLGLNRFTYFINNFWCRTSVSRWNFFCRVALPYL